MSRKNKRGRNFRDGHRDGESSCSSHQQNRRQRRIQAAQERFRLDQARRSGKYNHDLQR